MDPSQTSLHLAMAALFGASLMAISAFFIHERSVDQILDRLILIKRTNLVNSGEFEDDVVSDEEGDMGNENEEEEEEEEMDYRGKVENFNSNLNTAICYGMGVGLSSSVPNFNDGVGLFDDVNVVGMPLSSALDNARMCFRNGDGSSVRTSASSNRVDSEILEQNSLENTAPSNGHCKELEDRDAVPIQEAKIAADSTQKRRVAACERKSILDLPANGEIDMIPTEAEENDFNTVLPLKAAIPGDLNPDC